MRNSLTYRTRCSQYISRTTSWTCLPRRRRRFSSSRSCGTGTSSLTIRTTIRILKALTSEDPSYSRTISMASHSSRRRELLRSSRRKKVTSLLSSETIYVCLNSQKRTKMMQCCLTADRLLSRFTRRIFQCLRHCTQRKPSKRINSIQTTSHARRIATPKNEFFI